MKKLLSNILKCKECESYLTNGCRPVLAVNSKSKIVIIGQAPGKKVHETGIAWNDKSGENLRNWLGVNKEQFYDTNLFALMPMGFCYPGTGKSGDLPPRKECTPLWHDKLFKLITDVKLILLIGKYAQEYYLKDLQKDNLTQTVKAYKEYLPQYLPLPHPSPRNNIWQKKNEWFAKELLPQLKQQVSKIISS